MGQKWSVASRGSPCSWLCKSATCPRTSSTCWLWRISNVSKVFTLSVTYPRPSRICWYSKASKDQQCVQGPPCWQRFQGVHPLRKVSKALRLQLVSLDSEDQQCVQGVRSLQQLSKASLHMQLRVRVPETCATCSRALCTPVIFAKVPGRWSSSSSLSALLGLLSRLPSTCRIVITCVGHLLCY